MYGKRWTLTDKISFRYFVIIDFSQSFVEIRERNSALECRPHAAAPKNVLLRQKPTNDRSQTRSFHKIEKWKWNR